MDAICRRRIARLHGRNCQSLDDEVTAEGVQSLLYQVPIICKFEEILKDVVQSAVDTGEGMFTGFGATVKGIRETAEAVVRVWIHARRQEIDLWCSDLNHLSIDSLISL